MQQLCPKDMEAAAVLTLLYHPALSHVPELILYCLLSCTVGSQPSSSHPPYRLHLPENWDTTQERNLAVTCKDVLLEAEALMSSVEGVCWERHQQGGRRAKDEHWGRNSLGGYRTKAVGKLRAWKAQEESECGRMEQRMVKNNSIVQLKWHYTGVLNLLPFKTLLSFGKRVLHLIVLIATDHSGPLSFCPAAPVFFTAALVVATKSSACCSLHPCLM